MTSSVLLTFAAITFVSGNALNPGEDRMTATGIFQNEANVARKKGLMRREPRRDGKASISTSGSAQKDIGDPISVPVRADRTVAFHWSLFEKRWFQLGSKVPWPVANIQLLFQRDSGDG